MRLGARTGMRAGLDAATPDQQCRAVVELRITIRHFFSMTAMLTPITLRVSHSFAGMLAGVLLTVLLAVCTRGIGVVRDW